MKEQTTKISIYKADSKEVVKQIQITTLQQESDPDNQHQSDVDFYIEDVLHDKYNWDEYEYCFGMIRSIDENEPYTTASTVFDYYSFQDGELIHSGKKVYYQIDNVGKAKYTINFHDGVKKHKDGSDFYDIEIFKNKKDLQKFINDLHSKGYKYKRS